MNSQRIWPSPSDEKRTRKTNFTSQETLVLISEFSTRRDVLLGKINTAHSHKTKLKAWSEVQAAVNAVSPVWRSIPEVRLKWKRLAQDARAQLRGKQPPPDGASKAAETPQLDLDLIRRISANDHPPPTGDAPPDQELDATGTWLSLEESPGPASMVQVNDSIMRLVEPLSGSVSSARTGGSLSQPGSAQSTSSIPDTENRQVFHETGMAPAQECVNTKRKSDISDAELRELERDRKEFEKQRAKAALRVQELEIDGKEFEKQRAKAALKAQELEIEKMQAELKHAAEIRELEKKKLQLEIQLLMKKTGEDE